MMENDLTQSSEVQAPDKDRSLYNWERVALIAALVILLSPFLYLLKAGMRELPPATSAQAVFVGSEKCK